MISQTTLIHQTPSAAPVFALTAQLTPIKPPSGCLQTVCYVTERYTGFEMLKH